MRAFSKTVVLGFDDAVTNSISDEELRVFKNVAHKILELINNKKIYSTQKIAKNV
jgi:hypothetical protein